MSAASQLDATPIHEQVRYWSAPYNIPVVGPATVVKKGAKVQVTTKSGKVKNVTIVYAAKVDLGDGVTIGIGYTSFPTPPQD